MQTLYRTPHLTPDRSDRDRGSRMTLRPATQTDREHISAIRHEVYAQEIGQHPANPTGKLSDRLDATNHYLVLEIDGGLAGFISITPPQSPSYSIDKYFSREELPFPVHSSLYEVRLLTVLKASRGSEIAALLMYGALRWVESRGGTHIMAIGREEVLSIYLKAGLRDCGASVQSGAVTYRLLHAQVEALHRETDRMTGLLDRLERHVNWQLGITFRKPAACFHGGAFFDRIGPRFDRLDSAQGIINADVLDAWYPPAPAVQETLERHLPWLLRTSPPTDCGGLLEVIAAARGVRSSQLLPGAGSSDLIFRAFSRWLTPASRVLLLDPTYGEYAHVLEKVIRCQVDRLTLKRQDRYEVPLETLKTALGRGYDLVVLVNPNSPTGRHITRQNLLQTLAAAPASTRVWIDETYVDFVDPAQSLETAAAQSENLIVCKSMSKAYALSGARVAYLCAAVHQLEELRAWTPPWVVSLPSQVAAVNALQSPAYYTARWAETRELRENLAAALRYRGFHVLPGSANYLLTHLPSEGPSAAELVSACRGFGLYLRDAGGMGSQLGDHALRFAVKDAATNRRMLSILDVCLD